MIRYLFFQWMQRAAHFVGHGSMLFVMWLGSVLSYCGRNEKMKGKKKAASICIHVFDI